MGQAPHPLPPEPPRVLFDGPVNATWAANHAAYWRDLGIDGFLFHGLIDTLDSLGEAETAAGDESPLTRELRVACQRLREAGLDRHFLYLSISPEDRWYTDRSLAREAITRFAKAGVLCRRAGLRGLAIDTNSASLIHDFRWDGYDLGATPAEEIRQGARDLARRALRAYIREHPEGEILIVTDRAAEAGPLFFDFFEGLLEGVGAADSLHLSLVPRESTFLSNPLALEASLERLSRTIGLRLSRSSADLWRHQGGYSLCLRPVELTGDGRSILSLPEDFRVQLAAAKAWSKGYCILEGPSGGWWRVSVEEAESYAESNQTGAGAVRPMTPVLEDLGIYRAVSPLDALRRIGPLPFQDGMAFVFRDRSGAVVLPWAGLPEGFVLEGRTASVPVTDLRTGETRTFSPADGVVRVPLYGGPVLLGQLPVGEWAFAAGMWLSFDTPLSADARRVRAHFGCLNATDLPLEGRLEALPPEGYSMGRAAFPVKLAPGERAAFQRTVQGIFFAGESADFGLGLTLSGGGQIRRTFLFRVQPKTIWEAQRDGALPGPPALFDFNGDNRPELLVTGRRGEIACYDGVTGTLLWEHRFQTTFDLPPAAGYGIDGTPHAIAVDHRGLLRIFDARGDLVREVDLETPCVENGLLVWPGILSDTIIAGRNDGRIQTYTFSGNLLGDYDLESPLRFLAPPAAIFVETEEAVLFPPPPVTMIFAVTSGEPPAIIAIAEDGSQQWRHDLEVSPATPPVVIIPPGTGLSRVMLGLDDGTVAFYHAYTGEKEEAIDTGQKLPVTALAAGMLDTASGPQILVANAFGVSCYANDTSLLWQRPLPHPTALTVYEAEKGACVLVSSAAGALYNLDKHGEIHWRDLRPGGPVSGAARIAFIDKDIAPDAAYCAADGRLRVIRLDPPVPLPGVIPEPLSLMESDYSAD
jgi:outer membrane protein assembly factor BamB